MAVDEAILQAVGNKKSLPTLRLYSWQPACLSLGYAQTYRDVDEQSLAENGWEVVRRLTGGRAILHIDELTYSIAARPEEPRVAGSVLESYHRLAEALITAVRQLGLPVEMSENSPQPALTKGPVCFEVPSAYEIVVAGKKLIGSAQARKKEGVLQHGTFPLSGDLGRINRALVYPDEETRQAAESKLLSRAVTAETILGRVIPWQEAADAFIHAFENVLNLKLEPGELTREELLRAEELVAIKYAKPEWTERL